MNETTITARPGTPFIDVVREFEAPPALVFRAWTDPELVSQWLWPSETTTTVLEYNATPAAATATSTATRPVSTDSAACSTPS